MTSIYTTQFLNRSIHIYLPIFFSFIPFIPISSFLARSLTPFTPIYLIFSHSIRSHLCHPLSLTSFSSIFLSHPVSPKHSVCIGEAIASSLTHSFLSAFLFFSNISFDFYTYFSFYTQFALIHLSFHLIIRLWIC